MDLHTVKIRNITLGEGKPKICLPITGKTVSEILSQAETLAQNPVDIIEWRADWFTDLINLRHTNQTISRIRERIGDIPLLFTIRTSNEGGEASLSFDAYKAILQNVVENPDIDAVDVEIHIANETSVTELIHKLKENAVVIASNHDFSKTPDEGVIIDRLTYMRKCGADVSKMAVMPKNTSDVLTLLSATDKASKNLDCPIITMSMGKLGLISRVSGEAFGSCLTFGCVGQASAPGQINANELNDVLDILHKNL